MASRRVALACALMAAAGAVLATASSPSSAVVHLTSKDYEEKVRHELQHAAPLARAQERRRSLARSLAAERGLSLNAGPDANTPPNPHPPHTTLIHHRSRTAT